MKGYKATDSEGKCRGYQFSLPVKNDDGSWTPGEWHDHEGDLKMCESGFHFCEFPSGPWAYYSTGRVFVVEAETVEKGSEPGASLKHVCKRIRFVREVFSDGDRNTGDYNTGHSNTGDRNTGHYNTGNRNTGYSNTGDSNTGDYNTGHSNTGDYNTGHYNTGNRNTGNRNTGYRNTGHSNTGDYNTGHSNTGDSNTGHYNTGNRNTGYRNTGYSNATDRSPGVFCQKEPTVKSFDKETGLTYSEFFEKFPIAYELGAALSKDDPIDFDKFKTIPGITKSKLKSLHAKHIAGRTK